MFGYLQDIQHGTFPSAVMSTQLEELAKHIKSNLESMECKFVDPFPKEVQTDCSICLHLLNEPYVVGCCGYRFCKSCLIPSIRCCPLCKTYNFDKLPDKQLERLLNQRAVYCLLQDSGCSWTGELNKLSSHLNYDDGLSKAACEYLPFPCAFCGDYFKRVDMSSHQSICVSRPSECTFCNYKCPFKDLSAHFTSCPKQPRLCKNHCGEQRFTPDQTNAHLANDCPLEVISCEFSFAGCGICYLRKDLEEHMDKRVKMHLRLMTTKYKQLQEKESKASSALQPLKEENTRLSKSISELSIKNTRLSKSSSELSIKNQELAAENEMLRKKVEEVKNIHHLNVTNFPPAVSKQHLKCVFGQFGTVEDITLNKPHNAIIKYSKQSEYEHAMAVNSARGINLLKHQLSLQLSYSS